ncbi:hypothetical protein SprV_0401639900 [Sparganum proliferum]
MIAVVESILNQTEATDETKNLIQRQVTTLLMAQRPLNVLSKVERDILKGLRADSDLGIVPADKGRSTVVLDRTDYIQKTKRLLENRQSYVSCESNPMKTLAPEINTTLLATENSGEVSPIDRRMNLTVEIIELLPREKYDDTGNRLRYVQIIQLLKFCLKTFFRFDGTIYKQVKGTPTGSLILGLNG